MMKMTVTVLWLALLASALLVDCNASTSLSQRRIFGLKKAHARARILARARERYKFDSVAALAAAIVKSGKVCVSEPELSGLRR